MGQAKRVERKPPRASSSFYTKGATQTEFLDTAWQSTRSPSPLPPMLMRWLFGRSHLPPRHAAELALISGPDTDMESCKLNAVVH